MQRYDLQVGVYDGSGSCQYCMEEGRAYMDGYYSGGSVSIAMVPSDDGKYFLVSDLMKYRRYLLKKWRSNATKT